MTQPPEPRVNAVITFVDGEGQEWIAAAVVGPLTRRTAPNAVPQLQEIQELNDATYRLRRFKVISQ